MLEGIGVLRNVRSEYGKAIRKQYEKGEFKISRHEFLKKEIREDGISNTIDSVQKDNMLAVEVKEATKQGFAVARGWRDAVNFAFPSSETRRGRVSKDMANTLDTQCNQGIFVKNLTGTHCVRCVVSEKAMLRCHQKADAKGMLQTSGSARRDVRESGIRQQRLTALQTGRQCMHSKCHL